MEKLARAAFVAACLAFSGCQPEAATSSTPKDDLAQAANVDPLVYRSRQVSYRLQAALARLRERMPPVTKFHTTACPDEQLRRQAEPGSERNLVLDIHDARYEARSLLPLELLVPLKTPERTLDRYFEAAPNAAGLQDSETRLGRLLRSDQDAVLAERELRELEQQRYKGIFHITLFKKPHLIRKENKLRREWTQGILQAWLVVYDIDTNESLCQAPVTSVSDVEGEPITIRLRADTQQRLVKELGQGLRSAGARALGSISEVLAFDAPELGSDARQVASLPPTRSAAREGSAATHSEGRQ